MRYLSGDVNAITFAVHKWKPITAEQFAALLHQHIGDYCDEFGHGGTSSTAWRLDQNSHGTIHYRKKERGSPVSSPFAMTMNTPAGKILCFGYIGDYSDRVPEVEDIEPRDRGPSVTVNSVSPGGPGGAEAFVKRSVIKLRNR